MKQFRTYQLAVQFYQEAKCFKLDHHLRDQLLRASSSGALNLVEGYGKQSRKDQRKFFIIAFGSLKECQAIFELENLYDHPIYDLADKTAAYLYKLIMAMR